MAQENRTGRLNCQKIATKIPRFDLLPAAIWGDYESACKCTGEL